MKAIKSKLKNTRLYLIRKRLKIFNRDELEQFIIKHYGQEKLSKALIDSMRNSYLFQGIRYGEFFSMKFENKSKKEIKAFVGRNEELALYYQVNPLDKYLALLEDKFLCYKFFQPYYKREIIKVDPMSILNNIKAQGC